MTQQNTTANSNIRNSQPTYTSPIKRKPFINAHLPIQSSPLSQQSSSPLFLETPIKDKYDNDVSGGDAEYSSMSTPLAHNASALNDNSDSGDFNDISQQQQQQQSPVTIPFPKSQATPERAQHQRHLRKLTASSVLGGSSSESGAFPKEYQSALRRFRSLSMTPSKKDRPDWTCESIRRKYTPEKTIELYDFSPEFETADLNQMLEPYQHHKCERGGYRIKWLNDTRALALFRRAEMASKVLDDLKSNKLVNVKPYQFEPEDLDVFNQRNTDDNGASGKEAKGGSGALSRKNRSGAQKVLQPTVPLEEEAVRIKYRSEVTIELYDFATPLETSDLQQLFTKYKSEDNIIRIKWFNKNRAIAWFTNPELVDQALQDLGTNETIHVRPYEFTSPDMRYFLPDAVSKSPAGSPSPLSRRRTISNHHSDLGRRNTVSGASHYQYHTSNNSNNADQEKNLMSNTLAPPPKFPNLS